MKFLIWLLMMKMTLIEMCFAFQKTNDQFSSFKKETHSVESRSISKNTNLFKDSVNHFDNVTISSTIITVIYLG